MIGTFKGRPIAWELVLWLTAAFASLCFSVFLWFFVDQLTGLFVAVWVPSILSFGALIRRK